MDKHWGSKVLNTLMGSKDLLYILSGDIMRETRFLTSPLET